MLVRQGVLLAAPTGLNHVAMSVPPGTLTDDYRAELLEFYGGLFGWRETRGHHLIGASDLAPERAFGAGA